MEYLHSSAFYEYHALNLNSKFSIGWGLFAGGWVGPEWRGGVSPATIALMLMFVLFVSNTMFFMLIACTNLWQRNALALIC